MSSRIETLTPEQIAAMPRYVEEWTRICTDPADRPAAEECVRMAYAAAGLRPPKRIVWTGSPLGNARVAASVADSVGLGLGLGLSQTEALVGLMQIVRSAGWFIPFADVCIISERHCTLHRDELGSLHCDTGPAVAYPDGWSIFAWHGVRVPEWVIMQPERITAETLAAEANAEVRRCMVERVGHERAIDLLGAKVVQSDPCGRLLKAAGHAWVDVENGTVELDGTRKRYLLKVPDTMRTAKQAVAWTYGLTARQYKVAVRT